MLPPGGQKDLEYKARICSAKLSTGVIVRKRKKWTRDFY
jgi:hypothetical protein